MEHAWEYGFVLRYPKGKIDVTGIIYEPWHYRYVGKEVAKELHESGLTLEEYLQNLS
jgi:D-alanyl-D-alanine carboxypeptidase